MVSYSPISSILVALVAIPIIAFALSVIYSYELRKISARLQGRRGPYFIVPKEVRSVLGTSRLLQPLYDILKLLYKESRIPTTSTRTLFVAAPYVALASVIATFYFVPLAGFSLFGQFEFSLVVISYLLLIIPLALTLGGASSSSPWGAIGAQREAELTLAYEVPQILGIFSLAIMANTLSITDLINYQSRGIPFIVLNPFAAVAVFVALLGKLQIKPFDISEAEVEIVAGPVTEYSGKLLGILEIMKTLLIFLVPAFFIDLFLGGGIIGTITGRNHALSALVFILETAIIVFVAALVHVFSPRFRVDQAFRWFSKFPLILGVVAIGWAYAIKILGVIQ
jgi:NADH-quinone oxidoreductase subunit H